ncbi:hypothetical protein [Candidatus Poriferisodalis sp.]|uniref:hypothetical protein n=1 Tax=Candidatus Poriferisodalis sp. TaxID=3101277 RepID=UPI003B51DB3A
MDPETFIEGYGSAIEAGQASVLIGAGLSVGAVVPEPLENHVLLAQLGIAENWTTNFDPLIEIANYSEITTMLQKLVARTRPARLFVSGSARTPGDAESTGSGSYPTAASNERLDRFAEVLGYRLADEQVPSVVAAGELGARVGYSYFSRLDPYDPRRFLLVRRRSNEDVGPPSLRQRQMQFIGDVPDMLRSAAFERVRAVVVLGGGPGTESEVSRAFGLDMAVTPPSYGCSHEGRQRFGLWGQCGRRVGIGWGACGCGGCCWAVR